jgi:glycosyltransferase involved in cell wall biosynthesis
MSRGLSAPAMVIPRLSTNATSRIDLLRRFNDYGKALRDASQGKYISLVLITDADSIENIPLKEFPYLQVLPVRTAGMHLGIFWIVAIKLMRAHSLKPVMLIAGDPWFGFLNTWLIRGFGYRSSKIQIQFHGDVYSRPSTLNLKNLVKYLIVLISLRVADSVRVVSEFQCGEISKIVPWLQDKFIVAPIPIDFNKISEDRSVGAISLGYVGRIHDERGLSEFLAILDLFKQSELSMPIRIIGDGPRKSWLLKEINSREFPGQITLTGNLDAGGLRNEYSRISFLLSTAPSEGYGMTLREAALSGVRVIAKKSIGSIEAERELPGVIQLFDTPSEAVDLIKSLRNKPITKVEILSARKNQEDKNSVSVLNLVRSWL